MTKINLLALVIALFGILLIARLIQKRKLRESYALLWFIAALSAAGVALFPEVLHWLMLQLQVEVPLNLIFFFYFLFLSLLSLQITLSLTKKTHQIEILAKEVGILKAEIEGLRNKDVS